MEVNFEEIQKVNQTIETTNIKGKEYAEVNQRVKAFRMLYPQGTIETELLSNDNGTCIIRAKVSDETGKLLGTGLAYEKENSSFINKTSYIENCETSAVGRALGMCGLGIDTSIASAEELENAINQQEKNKVADKVTDLEAKTIYALIQKNGRDLNKFLEYYKITNINELTKAQYAEALKMLKKESK